MKIHAQSCTGGPGAITRQEQQLRQLHAASAVKLHAWTESPDEADIIFLTDAQQDHETVLERHPFPRRYAEKCFVLSDQWRPPFLLAGVYANAPRAAFGAGRFRTGSYALHHPDFRNPFVEAHDYAAESALRAPDLLASFMGRNCHPVRRRLFALPLPPDRFFIEDTSNYDAFTHDTGGKLERQRRYLEICLRSKFILCPRGAGPNSIRLFEALRLGIAPVIIADAWIPCEGPAWDAFALFVPEKSLPAIGSILAAAEPEHRARGRLARRAHEEFFSPGAYFNTLVAAAASARRARIVPERVFVSLWPVMRFLRRAKRRSRRIFATT